MTNPVLVFVKIWENYSRICSFLGGIESACQCRRCKTCGFDTWVRTILWSRKWQRTLVFLSRKFHGQRDLQSMGSQRVRHDWENEHTLSHTTWFSLMCFYMLITFYVVFCFFFKLEMEPLTRSSKVFISDFCSLLKEGLDWPFDHVARGKTTWKEKITCRHFGELSTGGNFICLLALTALWWRLTRRNGIAS